MAALKSFHYNKGHATNLEKRNKKCSFKRKKEDGKSYEEEQDWQERNLDCGFRKMKKSLERANKSDETTCVHGDHSNWMFSEQQKYIVLVVNGWKTSE